MVKHMEYSIGDDHHMKPFFAKLSKDEISVLQKARRRLFQIKNDSISEINKDYLNKLTELREEYAGKLEKIMESINPVLNRLENAISTNLTLRSSTDEFILQLRQSISLEGENQERSLERSLFRCVGVLPCIPRRYFKEDERFNYYFQYNTKTCLLYTSPSPRDS